MDKSELMEFVDKFNGDVMEKPGSIVAQIYRSMGRAITEGSLKPGEILKEKELVDYFGVSKAPIREAIRMLEADRLVMVDAYRKKYVRKIRRADLLEVIPVMASLEGCAARITAAKINQEQIDDLRKINEDMKKAHMAGDMDACNTLNFRFHEFYVKTANNETLEQALRPMLRRVIRLWVKILFQQKHYVLETSINEHEDIVKAFFNRDAKEAEKRVREHSGDVLERALKASIFDEDGNFRMTQEEHKP